MPRSSVGTYYLRRAYEEKQNCSSQKRRRAFRAGDTDEERCNADKVQSSKDSSVAGSRRTRAHRGDKLGNVGLKCLSHRVPNVLLRKLKCITHKSIGATQGFYFILF